MRRTSEVSRFLFLYRNMWLRCRRATSRPTTSQHEHGSHWYRPAVRVRSVHNLAPSTARSHISSDQKEVCRHGLRPVCHRRRFGRGAVRADFRGSWRPRRHRRGTPLGRHLRQYRLRAEEADGAGRRIWRLGGGRGRLRLDDHQGSARLGQADRRQGPGDHPAGGHLPQAAGRRRGNGVRRPCDVRRRPYRGGRRQAGHRRDTSSSPPAAIRNVRTSPARSLGSSRTTRST